MLLVIVVRVIVIINVPHVYSIQQFSDWVNSVNSAIIRRLIEHVERTSLKKVFPLKEVRFNSEMFSLSI